MKYYTAKEIKEIIQNYKDLLYHIDRLLHANEKSTGLTKDVSFEELDEPVLFVFAQKNGEAVKYIMTVKDLYKKQVETKTKDLFED
jgi:hypothetical protein